jgi:multiple sugar transport system ATP-binding protein
MAKISLTGIGKSFGETHVLRGIDLTVEDGQFVTLVGPSGCGKSTLLRILAGLEGADTGTVKIGDRDVTRVRPADRNLAMVFQSYALYPHLTVAENMMTPLKLRDLGVAGRLPFLGPMLARAEHLRLREQVQRTAETLKIEALLDRKPGQLSGGQRQRAALGRAMVRNPVAFLMDEPLSNLDAALRVHMRAELSELHRRLETTFVYVTHDQAEALTMSDRMAVMMHGEILQYGRPSDVYNAPSSLEVAKFVGSPAINVLPGEIDGSGGLTVMGKLVLPDTRFMRQPVSVGIRPEHLALDPDGHFKGVIRHRENLGSDLFLHVQVEGLDQPVILRSHPRLLAGTGLEEEVAFSAIAEEVHIFAANGHRLQAAKPTLVEVA